MIWRQPSLSNTDYTPINVANKRADRYLPYRFTQVTSSFFTPTTKNRAHFNDQQTQERGSKALLNYCLRIGRGCLSPPN